MQTWATVRTLPHTVEFKEPCNDYNEISFHVLSSLNRKDDLFYRHAITRRKKKICQNNVSGENVFGQSLVKINIYGPGY